MKRLIKIAACAVLCLALVAAAIPYVAAEDAAFYASAELLAIQNHIEKDAGMGSEATVQGACTDGRYAYYAVQGGSTVLLKYDVKTWRLVKKRTVAGLGHANDMAYNSKEKFIVVANNAPDYKTVSILNPDTLTVEETVELKVGIYSIAYVEKSDRYVVGISGGYKFAILDHDFKVKKKFEGLATGYTRQGCDADESYIYFAQSGGSNVVAVYDYQGEQVALIPLGHTHEVENIFHVGSSFYITLHYYGNYVYRVGLSDASMISYRVHYDPGAGMGEMKDTKVHYGHNAKLRACSFTRPGYFFGGWRVFREFDDTYRGYRNGSATEEWLKLEDVYEYDLFADRATVSKTTKIGDITLTAFWISELYDIYFDSDGGEGWMDTATVRYADGYTLPENTFTKEGFIFSGYTAARSYDDRVYGYRKNSDRAEWLDERDLYKEHVFYPGDQVKKLTYDGLVTFTAQFRPAYIFDDEGGALVEYIGIDEIVNIPKPTDHFTTIAGRAFHDNDIMTELHIPDTVEVMQKDAISACTALRRVVFEENFPDDFDTGCITDSGVPLLYERRDGRIFFLGFAADRHNAALIRNAASALDRDFTSGRYGA